jgi:hypothetical protein
MTGPVEEAGKAAASFMDSLKSQPLSLALVVMNMALLGLIYFALVKQADVRSRDLASIHTLLSQCISGNRSNTTFGLQSDETETVPLPPLRPLESETK